MHRTRALRDRNHLRGIPEVVATGVQDDPIWRRQKKGDGSRRRADAITSENDCPRRYAATSRL
eukprot:7341479-Pyramimonas_sp.AAC.1